LTDCYQNTTKMQLNKSGVIALITETKEAKAFPSVSEQRKNGVH